MSLLADQIRTYTPSVEPGVKDLADSPARGYSIRTFEPPDPFLSFQDLSGDGELSIPAHPHAGIETVTYVLEGSFRHRNTATGAHLLNAGQAQVLVAGMGTVHDEASTGRVRAIQIWINLDENQKRGSPRYRQSGVQGHQIAEGLTATQLMYHHARADGGLFMLVDPAHSVFVYALSGDVVIEDIPVKEGQALVLQPGLQTLLFRGAHAEVLVFGAKPLGVTVSRWNGIVMDSPTNVAYSYQRWIRGRMGRLS